MKSRILIGHLVVWGLILAMALGAVAWEVSINLPPNVNAYSNKPATLTWQLAAGQDALAEKIENFYVYYKTARDNQFSMRQIKSSTFKHAAPYDTYSITLPDKITAFRLESHYKDPSQKVIETLPRLSVLNLNARSILRSHSLNAQFEHRLRYASWLYEVPLCLNGWAVHLFFAATTLWILLMVGLDFLLGKSLAAAPKQDQPHA